MKLQLGQLVKWQWNDLTLANEDINSTTEDLVGLSSVLANLTTIFGQEIVLALIKEHYADIMEDLSE